MDEQLVKKHANGGYIMPEIVCLEFISKANGVYIRNYLFSMNIMEEIFAIRSFELSWVRFNVTSHSTQCS